MSKKYIMKIHSSTIFILNTLSLIRNSTDTPLDLKIERQMKQTLLQRLKILSISEMMRSRPHLYRNSMRSFFEANMGSRNWMKKENLL